MRIGLVLAAATGSGGSGGFSISFSPDPAPPGQLNVVYAGLTTHFHRGKPPRVFSLFAGTLPTGLTLDSATGNIAGTPTQTGTFTGLVIRCTDANGNTADTSPFSILVTA